MDMNNLSSRELLHFGIYASKTKRSDVAIQYLKRLVDIEPNNYDGLFLLGSEYAEVGLFEEGINAMKQVIESVEDAHLVRFQLAMLYVTTGLNDKALKQFQVLSDLPGDNALSIFSAGLTAIIQEEKQQGIALLEKGLTLPSNNDALSQNMSKMLEKIKASDGADSEQVTTMTENSDDRSSKMFLSVYDS